MTKVFFLIDAESGFEDGMLKDLKKIEEMYEAYASYGVYGLIARAKIESMAKPNELVTRRVRTLSDVRSTLTLIATKE